jgi:hypothetical protein
MSIKSKVFVAAATLTLVGGSCAAGVFTAGTANAVTPACGKTCTDLFTRNFGTYPNPGFLLDVLRQGELIAQPLILFRPANSDAAEDFTVAFQDSVSDFNAAGLVSNALDLHYGGAGCEDYSATTSKCLTFYPNDEAVEIEYSPFGVDSGLCMGTATTAVNGTEVSLQPCGVTAKTTWIIDAADAIGITPPPSETPTPSPTDTDLVTGPSIVSPAIVPAAADDPFFPLINGSGTNFSHPAVLAYPQNSYPTDMPRAQLITQTLQIDSHNVVNASEMWGADEGVAP